MSALNLTHRSSENISLLIEEKGYVEEFTEDDDDASEEKASRFKKLEDEEDLSVINVKCVTKEERRFQRINSDLLTSIEDGDVERFHTFLRKGASVDATCEASKLTACHAAIFFDRCELLEELLKNGAQLLPMQNNGCYPQHIAAWKGCKRCFETLHAHQPASVSEPVANLDSLSGDEQNATTTDSWYHDHQQLRSIQIPFIAEGSTPLHIVCRQLHDDCIEFLLHNNADIGARDSYGRLALDMITKTIEMIHDLKERNTMNADERCTARFNEKEKVLHSSTESIQEFDPRVTSVDNLRFDKIAEAIIFFLVNHQAASATIPETVRPDGDTFEWRSTYALHSAVITQNEKLMKFLLSRNVDVQVCTSLGDTPLHLAVRCTLRASLDVLIDDERIRNSLEVKESEGKTPLLLAAEKSWNYGVNILLEAGSTFLAITDVGDNILHLAAKTNNVALLQEVFGAFAEIKQLLNYKNILHQTPLMIAISGGHFQCVKTLLAVGADCRVRDENTNTIVHLAAREGRRKVLELILHHQPDLLNVKTKFNETPLHVAVVHGHIDCVKLLLRKGSQIRAEAVEITQKDNQASTLIDNFNGAPVHYAAMVGQLDMLECLFEHDYNMVNVINEAGWCPLQTAVQFNRTECAEYILKHGGNLSNKCHLNGSVVTVCDTLCNAFHEPASFLERIWDASIEIISDERSSRHPPFESSVLLNFSILHPSKNRTEKLNVLHAIVRCSVIRRELRNKILLHPLTQVFVDNEWRRVGKYPVIISLVLHFILFNGFFWLNAVINNPTALRQSAGRSTLMIMLVCLLLLYAKEAYLLVKRSNIHLGHCQMFVKCISYVTITATIALYGLYGDEVKTNKLLWWRTLCISSVILLWDEISNLLLLLSWCSMQMLFIRRAFLTVIKVTWAFVFSILGVIALYELISRNDIFPETWRIFECPNRQDSQIVLDQLLYTFVLTLLGISWLLIIMIFFVYDVRYAKDHAKLRIMIAKIEYLKTLQIFLYDDQFMHNLPQKLQEIIKRRRKFPESFSMSNKEFEKYKRRS